MALDEKYGEIEIKGIPKTEPVFVIRAKDKAAVHAIRGYAAYAGGVGAEEEFLESVLAQADVFAEWQDKNVAKVKPPD